MKTTYRALALVCSVAVAAGVGTVTFGAGTAAAAPCGNRGILGSALGDAFGSAGSSGLLGRSSSQGDLPRVTSGNTRTIRWITGPRSANRTDVRFGITGTDLGLAWDNGSGQTLMAFGDTFGNCNAPRQQWRHNVVLRTSDTDPSDGVSIGYGVPGDVRSGASVSAASPRLASEAVPAVGISGVEKTTVPTAAIAIDGVQYMNYMSVRQWGAPGRWVTNYSAIATSRDNGQTWQSDNKTIRLNSPLDLPGVKQDEDGNGRFQVNAYLRAPDGFIYQYGTPNGRFGASFLSRFRPKDILNLSAYEYFSGDPRRPWSRKPIEAKAVVREPVGETSVVWNTYLQRYVMTYGQEQTGALVLRTAKRPEGPWSAPRNLLTKAQSDGVYAPLIYPASASATQSGRYLYLTASRWFDYNVMLLRTDLSQIPAG